MFKLIHRVFCHSPSTQTSSQKPSNTSMKPNPFQVDLLGKISEFLPEEDIERSLFLVNKQIHNDLFNFYEINPERIDTVARTLKGHTNRVVDMIFSSDGTKIASRSIDGIIKVWDLMSGDCISTLERMAGRITYSSDGNMILFESKGHIFLWNLKDDLIKYVEDIVQFDPELPTEVMGMAVSPDGKEFIIGFNRGIGFRVYTYDVESKSASRSHCVQLSHGTAQIISYSPDGKTLAIGGQKPGSIISLFKADTKDLITEIQLPYKTELTDLLYSSNGKTVRALERTGESIWDIATGEKVKDGIANRNSWINWSWNTHLISYSPNGRIFASISPQNSNDIEIWDFSNNCKSLARLSGHKNAVTSLCISSNGKLLASGSVDGEIKIWNMTSFERKVF